jgi:exosortase K
VRKRVTRRLAPHQALWLWIAATALGAVALKAEYSAASAAQLGWMLRPVAWMLQGLLRLPFHLTPAGEWQCDAAGIVLVKACAGINFMVMSFLGWCWLGKPVGTVRMNGALWWRWSLRLAGALVAAWLVAVLVNATRILVLIAVGPALDSWLGTAMAHRLIGLAVFLPALTAQLLIGERQLRGQAAVVAGALYLLVMIATPLLTGEAMTHATRYREHALTLLTVIAPLLLWGVLSWFRHRARLARGEW